MTRLSRALIRPLLSVRHAFGSAGQLRALAVKEVLQLGRDRVLLFFIGYLFTVNILMAGGSPSHEASNVRLVVHDADHSEASRDLVYRFRPPYFRYKGEAAGPKEGARMLADGKAVMFLDIPERFGKTLLKGGRPAKVQLSVDTSKAMEGYLATSYAGRIGATFGRDWAIRGASRYGPVGAPLPAIDNRRRVLYNATLNNAWFSTIGELFTMMTFACILLPASAMVREKERGTIEQLLVSPLSPFQILFSKVLAMVGVMVIAAAVSVFLIMKPAFGVPTRGSLALFFALTALYAFTNAGVGLLISTVARNSAQSGMLILLIVMPIANLSGTWTPLDGMPGWLRQTMNLSPLLHFNEIGYGILLRGAGWATLWDSVLAMALLGIAFFALGMWRFRRQFR